MSVPILVNHDHQATPIGVVEVDGGSLHFVMREPIPHSEIFEIFGNVGVLLTVMEYDKHGTLMVRAGRILEFSRQ